MSRRATVPRRSGSLARLLGSCAAIVAVVAGVPTLLVGLSRSALGAAHPIPGIGTVEEIRAYLERGLSMVELMPLAVRALLCVAWLLWGAVVVSLLGSVAESRLGTRLGLPRFGALGSPGAWIIGGFATLGSLAPAGVFAGGVAEMPFTLNQSYSTVEAARFAVPEPNATVAVPTGHAEVRPGESAETFAARLLGAAERWEEIWQLNRNQPVGPAAEVWSEAWNLLPGSILRLPADAVPADPTPVGEDGAVRLVEEGDSYWTIAADALGPSARRADIADLTVALVDSNAPRLGHTDPERLHPGDVVYISDLGLDLDELRQPAVAAHAGAALDAHAGWAENAGPADVVVAAEHVVVADDSYWSIAERLAVERHGADDVDNGVVYDLMVELRARNAPLLGHRDPDLLRVGDVLLLTDPDDPAVARIVDPPAVTDGDDPTIGAAVAAGAVAAATGATTGIAPLVVGSVQQSGALVAGAANAAVLDSVATPTADAADHPPTAVPVVGDAIGDHQSTGDVTVPTSSLAPPVADAAAGGDDAASATEQPSSPAPIGLGEGALLAAGLLGLLAARRRRRLRAAEPPARVPVARPADVVLEQQLRSITDDARVVRVDIALRSLAVAVADAGQRVTVVRAAADGSIGVRLSGPAQLPAPWLTRDGALEWALPGSVALDELSAHARSSAAPCLVMTALGVTPEDEEILVDLEGLELLSVVGGESERAAVVHAIAVGLASCELAGSAQLIGVGVDPDAFLGHPHAHVVADATTAAAMARTLVGSMSGLARSTFELRARRTGGDTWDPVVVIVASSGEPSGLDELIALSRTPGVAVVIAGEVPAATWILAPDGDAELPVPSGRRAVDRWRLDPLGVGLRPVAADPAAVRTVSSLLTSPTVAPAEHAVDVASASCHPVVSRLAPLSEWASPLIVGVEPGTEPDAADHADPGSRSDSDPGGSPVAAGVDGPPGSRSPMPLATMRLMGPVEVVDAAGAVVPFERAKPLELLAWMATHRHHSTRAGARTAMWLTDVRDATFANVVSEARRAMIKAIPLPAGEEWVGRTLNEQLVLHRSMLTDADVIVAALDDSDELDAAAALQRLRPAVEMIRGVPFAGGDYLWPDAEGLTAELVLLATTVTARYAERALACGDVDGVFWATGVGLQVIAGQESLIALRMRAHAERGDHSGVRVEWESYQRVVTADPWGDGELSPKLVELRRELLAS